MHPLGDGETPRMLLSVQTRRQPPSAPPYQAVLTLTSSLCPLHTKRREHPSLTARPPLSLLKQLLFCRVVNGTAHLSHNKNPEEHATTIICTRQPVHLISQQPQLSSNAVHQLHRPCRVQQHQQALLAIRVLLLLTRSNPQHCP